MTHRPEPEAQPADAGSPTLETELRDLVASLLAIRSADVDPRQPLGTIGLDSLNVVELQTQLASRFALELDAAAFFEDVTIAELAERIRARPGTPARRSAPGRPDVDRPRRSRTRQAGASSRTPTASPAAPMQFSLFYFSAAGDDPVDDRYRLLLDGARFADRNGFAAVWVPERHFHPFGGLYPNPAVLAAALAASTRRVRLRAGSVVLPLHSPLRVAEEWAVVDNLSGGRVDLAFASGWNADDFALAPAAFADRTGPLYPAIETVRRLWRGEALTVPNGQGQGVALRTYPRPRQPELPYWITCTGGRERFVEAGAVGANVLTALLFQSVEQLAERLGWYREARARHGFDPATGHVTVMLHTFVGTDDDAVRSTVRRPFVDYLASSVDLWRRGAPSLDALSDDERARVLAYAFERYVRASALVGTPASCQPMVRALAEIGVDEIACLIDFGVEASAVLASLASLRELQELAAAERAGPRPPGPNGARAPRPRSRPTPAPRPRSRSTPAPGATTRSAPAAEPTAARTVDPATLLADARLDRDFPSRVVAPPRRPSPRAVLLTGATGFLGTFLLRRLLEASAATVYCLVRAPDRGGAERRLRAALDRLGLWDTSAAERVVAVPGNLSRPSLGLSATDFGALSETVDTIYHNAAAVSFVASYGAIRPINVVGTAEVLRFAARGRVKALHYVSTASVFDSARYAGRVIGELDQPDDARDFAIGYAQSKWVAERLAIAASTRGLPVSVYRPAWISGHSQTGACNTEDFLSRLVASCVRLERAPRLDYRWNLVPVDYVSQAIVQLSLDPRAAGRTFHLANPAPLAWERFVALIGEAGYRVRPIAYDRWRSRLLGAADHPDDGLRPLAGLFSSPFGRRRDVPLLYERERMPVFDGSATAGMLARSGIACPPADARLVRAYLSYWQRAGLLPAPRGSATGVPSS
jgi:natural product biosynthesis luciferase-like monooxygenase protein/thioester reductase-like protein